MAAHPRQKCVPSPGSSTVGCWKASRSNSPMPSKGQAERRTSESRLCAKRRNFIFFPNAEASFIHPWTLEKILVTLPGEPGLQISTKHSSKGLRASRTASIQRGPAMLSTVKMTEAPLPPVCPFSGILL